MLFRVGNASGHKPRSAYEKLAQPVPYTGGAPGDLGFNGRAACGVLSFFAVLGSLHSAFICAHWKLLT